MQVFATSRHKRLDPPPFPHAMLTNAWGCSPHGMNEFPRGASLPAIEALPAGTPRQSHPSTSRYLFGQAGPVRIGNLYPSLAPAADEDRAQGREPALPDRTPASLWETALGQLELQVTRPNFDTWLRYTEGLRLEADVLTVGVPSDFAIEWLGSRMASPINRTVSNLLGRPVSVSFQVLGAPSVPTQPSANGPQITPAVAPPPPQLNRRFTFDSFTVVKTNRLAYRAALRLADGESQYNPLILHGGPGLGKTHLLNALAHRALKAGRRVIFLTGDAFVDGYSRAVAAGRRQAFRDQFAQCDLLLLDDLQFLATRPGSQDQFLHIFNALHSSGRYLALALNVHPTALSDLTTHLRSRLLAGLTIELCLPPPGECLAILRAKAAELSSQIPDSTLQLVLQRPYQHITDLEGALNRLDAFASLTGASPSSEALDDALHPFRPAKALNPDAVLNAVSQHLRLTTADLSGPSRARDVTYARHIAMYLLRHLSHRPLTEIGSLLGGRDHSTVASGCQRIQQELASLPQTYADIQQLTAALHTQSAA